MEAKNFKELPHEELINSLMTNKRKIAGEEKEKEKEKEEGKKKSIDSELKKRKSLRKQRLMAWKPISPSSQR